MLLAHIVDSNVYKIHFVSFTNKENITFDTTPFRKIDKKQIYPYHTIHDLNNQSTVYKYFDVLNDVHIIS